MVGRLSDYPSMWLEFRFVKDTGKTQVWEVWSKSRRAHSQPRHRLGVIRWYAQWRQYAFLPECGTVFNTGCLVDIQRAIEELMEERGSARDLVILEE